jgi:hypothetical protein
MPARIAAAVAATSLLLAPAALADDTTPATLSVDGTAAVYVTPDLASLSLSVARSAPTAAAALSALDRRVDAIIGAVRTLGVPAGGFTTNSISDTAGSVLQGPRKHRRRVRIYRATESLSITSSSAIVGSVIDAATHAGAQDINGPDFSFSNFSAGMTAATTAAVANALGRAQSAAAVLGYTVTGVQSVDLNPNSGVVSNGSSSTPVPAPPPIVRTKPTTSTSTQPGTQEVEANVTVVFTIGPA